MQAIPVIVVFDVGKTNKKLFVFDEQYRIVLERTARFTEITDEDGDACENLESLTQSVYDSLHEVFDRKDFRIKAVNVSAYGASLVYVDEHGKPLAPLYNYLKQYPAALQQGLYNKYGGQDEFLRQTASPALGSLNSGLQLYRLKAEQPAVFNAMQYALHLPQYISSLISGKLCSDITSIGCHTALWDFDQQAYHAWVKEEGLLGKLAPMLPSNKELPGRYGKHTFMAGTGLHDSSAALIPYLLQFPEPFVLISTGTWCISLNPFNDVPLSKEELAQDCLCYLSYEGRPVKASRLFAGNEHEQQVKRIAAHFSQHTLHYRSIPYDARIMAALKPGVFERRDLHAFSSDVEAYHQLVLDIAVQQYHSTQLVLKDRPVKRIFVDGGFGKNEIYMHLLASMFPDMEVYAATIPQATALGAALALHAAWNSQPLPEGIIELKRYQTGKQITLY
ncbi:carbohydrate kinase [Chitinophaga alhagiae]|uniref:Carbohydrate kinase n=1 Tax=Chitinophaga alhagiae TaxID=2203219 RepID=A0ABM6WD97_9BACT|nr:FGGY family carbohydrate kinase [Chitinophaga alhagiae]AWO01972.1 carbohydrate kinase [Chitinophaga alhagiae]